MKNAITARKTLYATQFGRTYALRTVTVRFTWLVSGEWRIASEDQFVGEAYILRGERIVSEKQAEGEFGLFLRAGYALMAA